MRYTFSFFEGTRFHLHEIFTRIFNFPVPNTTKNKRIYVLPLILLHYFMLCCRTPSVSSGIVTSGDGQYMKAEGIRRVQLSCLII